ncbi:MAG: 23S rRNA (uracil(1939)-C(5))-methyltransferase RlmD [Lachnospiraceae bacterium]|nr:23S rRNA (uracil(1939)-C(5))-methyltransferase RlmD [Lachnospiraceae bacterium]
MVSPCPHFPACGGCTYLKLPYEASARYKEEQVRQLLAPVLERQEHMPEWETMLPAPSPFAYRNKMEFTFGDEHKDGPLALGLHKRGSFHDILSVTDCLIVDADYRRILKATLDFFSPLYERGEVSYYHRKKQSGWLRHLLVRKAKGTGEILIDLVTTSGAPAAGTLDAASLLKAYAHMLYELPFDGTLAGVLHTVNDALSDAIIDQGTTVLYGKDSFEESLLGLTFTVTPFSFFQTNSAGAALLYETVRRYVREAIGDTAAAQDAADATEQNAVARTGTVYDLYCGTGTITQLLSPAAKRVVGVELVEEAVEAAKESAARNGIDNCTFIAGDVLKVLDSLTEPPDLIVLDPPRDGIHPKALPKILAYGVPHIIYVSCKPASLARDLPFFLQQGYNVKRLVCADQFPWTKHCETVCLLSNRKPDARVKIDVDLEDYYRIKDEQKKNKASE